MEEWKRILKEEAGLSLAERKANQLAKLQQVIRSLHSYFGPNLVSTVKKIRKEALNEEETNNLQNIADKDALSDRVKGLISVFYKDFYLALEAETGISFAVAKEQPETDETKSEMPTPESGTESSRTSKLPKGFNKWDLKLIKLHESRPADGKRIWVEFWSLKGLTGVGEILFNPTKNLYYFKPYDLSTQSFAMTDEHGRKATSLARNYYFRVSPNPPLED